jgi:prefoldin subunit 5
MKRYLLLFLFLTSVCYADVNQTGPYIVKTLQNQVSYLTNENSQISRENEQLTRPLADKDREIKRLQTLCRKNNIDPNGQSSFRGTDIGDPKNKMASTRYAEVNQTGSYIVRSLQKQIETLTQENEQIKQANEQYKQQLADKDRKIERLQALCRKNNIDPNEYFSYRGEKRTREWLDGMYKRFAGKIAFVGGKYVEFRTSKPEQFSNNFVEVGTIVTPPGYLNTDYSMEVASVIGNDEVLIRCRVRRFVPSATSHGYWYEIEGFTYHLRGYGHPVIVGQVLGWENLICIGTYKSGLDGLVQSFAVWRGQPEPLTKEQFAEAIGSGFELVNYVEQGGKTIKVPIR